jgi:CRP-like cAMP-binding protein
MVTRKESLDILRNIPLLQFARERDLSPLLKPACIVQYAPKETVFCQGDSGSHMFVVLSGRVRIWINSGIDRCKTLAHIERGGFFGEMALMGGYHRSASAEATEATCLLKVSESEYKNLLRGNWPMTEFLLGELSQRLRRTNDQLENLLSHNVLGRVSKTLHQMVGQNGQDKEDGILIPSVYTHQEIADIVGTTREPIARAISSLRQAKLLEIRNKRFFILDPARLASIAGAN